MVLSFRALSPPIWHNVRHASGPEPHSSLPAGPAQALEHAGVIYLAVRASGTAIAAMRVPQKDISIRMDPPKRMAMRHARRVVVLAAGLAAAAFSAKAQQGDIAAGHAFAQKACKACHKVEEPSP